MSEIISDEDKKLFDNSEEYLEAFQLWKERCQRESNFSGPLWDKHSENCEICKSV